MHPAIRTQVVPDDIHLDLAVEWDRAALNNSRANGQDFYAGDLARQEQKDGTDINKILGQHNPMAQMRETSYGNVDFGIDLQTAMYATDAASRMYDKLPQGLKERFPTWQAVLNALHSGELKVALDKEAEKIRAAAAEAAAPKTAVEIPTAKTGSGTTAGSRRATRQPDSRGESDEPDA